DVKLQPLVIGDAERAWFIAAVRPVAPRRAVHLAERVERREVAQRSSLPGDVSGQALRFWRDPEDLLQRLRFEAENLVVIDQPLLVETARRIALSGHVDFIGALDFLDAQVEDVAKTACRGV